MSLLLSVTFTKTNRAKATCDNPPQSFTQEEYDTCQRIKEFMVIAKARHSEGDHNWRSSYDLGITQWHNTVSMTPLSHPAIQHIEAVLYDAGWKELWNASHSFSLATENVLWQEITPMILQGAKHAVITTIGVTVGASLYLHKATVLFKDGTGRDVEFQIPHTRTITHHADGRVESIEVEEASIFQAVRNFIQNEAKSYSDTTWYALPITIAYIGGKVLLKMYEDLPLKTFKTQKEIEQYLETLP